jgi:thiol-disulfide isomerase/thioredoxin
VGRDRQSLGTHQALIAMRRSAPSFGRSIFAALPVLVGALAFASGCSRVDESPRGTDVPSVTKPAPKKLLWTRAPKGELLAVVAAHVKQAESQGRVPLVYVGATWCEPCQHFHRAAERGDLDASFGDLAILELDANEDEARIQKAGYTSTYIPLFVLPGPDGRGTERRMAGSIKGEGAVAEIAPRLTKLLGR